MNATRAFEVTVGNPDIDPDRDELVHLLDSLDAMCKDPTAANGGCDHCPQNRGQSCQRLLISMGAKMQAVLLNHFQREEQLMQSLPRTTAIRIHCARHRTEHVNFSTQYNLAVRRLASGAPAVAARQIENLVLEWVRSHALEYDVKLSLFLKN